MTKVKKKKRILITLDATLYSIFKLILEERFMGVKFSTALSKLIEDFVMKNDIKQEESETGNKGSNASLSYITD